MGSPEELAASIATAFVATFYGVALANLLYLPIANKLKLQLSLYLEEKGMIIDGLLAIHDFENPSTIKGRLSVYLKFAEGSKKASSSDKKIQEAGLSHEQAK
jgi:chemotaxis protein MotA